MIKKSTIIEINKLLNPNSYILNDNIDSCLSSYFYYDTLKEQIASIIHGIIKNHYFNEANKRTAHAVFIHLMLLNNINPKYREYGKKIEDIAKNNYSIKQVVDILF